MDDLKICKREKPNFGKIVSFKWNSHWSTTHKGSHDQCSIFPSEFCRAGSSGAAGATAMACGRIKEVEAVCRGFRTRNWRTPQWRGHWSAHWAARLHSNPLRRRQWSAVEPDAGTRRRSAATSIPDRVSSLCCYLSVVVGGYVIQASVTPMDPPNGSPELTDISYPMKLISKLKSWLMHRRLISGNLLF